MCRILQVSSLSQQKWLDIMPKVLKQAKLEAESSSRIYKATQNVLLIGMANSVLYNTVIFFIQKTILLLHYICLLGLFLIQDVNLAVIWSFVSLKYVSIICEI